MIIQNKMQFNIYIDPENNNKLLDENFIIQLLYKHNINILLKNIINKYLINTTVYKKNLYNNNSIKLNQFLELDDIELFEKELFDYNNKYNTLVINYIMLLTPDEIILNLNKKLKYYKDNYIQQKNEIAILNSQKKWLMGDNIF